MEKPDREEDFLFDEEAEADRVGVDVRDDPGAQTTRVETPSKRAQPYGRPLRIEVSDDVPYDDTEGYREADPEEASAQEAWPSWRSGLVFRVVDEVDLVVPDDEVALARIRPIASGGSQRSTRRR